ncbi:DNA (cytosine-5-)-methyltransferase [Clostridium tagluense]|uniref:DNA (cytosine-5-)-methyltransferase n=1 Tax=Clostridium TaxID=1485 RepID=UPI0013E92FF2|nr:MULTISPECIES: DNA (cytosine-5-)-methyltransferase [Clostridium]MBZ9622149.1 DNA (cytosine-5-)-methyltransferase [Clostridium sp. FP2]MCB2313455.1 DNA (cytosine-5-)-methyltransferase [Clostridium tagluense]MCB2318278.1 DNA (cytosine-5-)-methyltransferase [Clostridium tagluense]MCB2323080.1 DNA (cytosine-5-)-methyltransferase [Clostridium tagluense]MCB2328062.1 DNA (cytosine-5-)-methyltransferase [Clostridium tagluense]
MNKTICELFAGVGGFRVGFEKSCEDWITVWANQWEPNKKTQHAFECYKTHFEEHGGINEYSNTDISKVPTDMIPEHSVLVGGFPCQDYSVASTGALGIHGKKGILWWEIERILKEKTPPFVLLENVDRLLKSPTSQRGRDFGIILACLNNLGYYVEWRVINAAEYGFQQRRRRTFIFAAHKSTNYYITGEKDVKSILQSEGFFSSTFNVSDFTEEEISHKEMNCLYPSDILDILNISNNFEFEFRNSGVCFDGRISTVKTTPNNLIKNPPLTLFNLLEKSVDERYYLSEEDFEKWHFMKGGKAIERTSKTGHKYTFREGALSFPDSIDKPARTMLTSEASKNRSTHVVADLTTKKLRLLTPIECEKINGFPADWTNTGMPHSFRYFCMGNALVVDIVTLLAKTLHNIIEKED